MNNLESSGLSLRTMKPKALGEFAADLNYNLKLLLQLPGFKGRPGESVVGPSGIGTRGSSWFFVATRLASIISTYGLTGGAQVTKSFLNTAFTNNQVQLATALGLEASDAFVIGDSIVLTSGQVLQLKMIAPSGGGQAVPTWTDTAISFEQSIGLTEDRVIELINSAVGAPSDADSTFRRFAAVAKNFADEAPGNNNASNTDSAIDIPVAAAGPGVVVPNHYFVSPKETAIGANTSACLLAGSPAAYHALVQRTQTNLTNSYIPGVDDFAAGIFLQSSYNNGIVMGHKDSATLRDFLRIYRSASAMIMQSHYDPDASKYSEIQLAKSSALVRATDSINVQANLFEYIGDTLRSKFFKFSGTTASIADQSASHSLDIWAKAGIYLKYVKDAQILSTDSAGKIVNTHSIITDLASANSNMQLLSALAIKNAIDAINTTLSSHNDRITLLENANATTIFKARNFVTTTIHLNNLLTEGNTAIKKNTTINGLPSSLAPMTLNDIEEFHVNVYRVQDQSENANKIVQELLLRSSQTNPNNVYARDLRFIRFATGAYNSSSVSWSGWTRTLTTADDIQIGTGLAKTGSFLDGNLNIRHASRSSNVPETLQFADGYVIGQIQHDASGHATQYTSKNLDDRYYTEAETYTRQEIEDLIRNSTKYSSGVFTNMTNGTSRYIYPPVGMSMSNLVGTMVSVARIGLNGHGHKYNVSHVFRCQYFTESTRIRVEFYNKEATTEVQNVNYLAIWKA